MTVRQVWFMPWCRVTSPVVVGPVVLEPGEHVLRAATPDERTTLETIFAAHRVVSGRLVPTPAVLRLGEDPLRELTDHERIEAYEAARVLAFLGIAGNEYFSSRTTPLNATHFSLTGQNFTPGATGLAMNSRRRNGTCLAGGYDYREVQILAPPEASPQVFDGGPTALRKALNTVWDSPVGRQIRMAIWWFERANTDSAIVPQDAEVKLIATAFEIVANATTTGAKAAHIREVIAKLIDAEYISKPNWLGQSKKSESPSPKPTWTTFQFWWSDFYWLRNCMEHEGQDSRPTTRWGRSWSVFQNMLIATVLFPQLVRGLLVGEGVYTWGEDDERAIGFLDHLLQAPGFQWDSVQDFESVVDEAGREAATAWLARRLRGFNLS